MTGDIKPILAKLGDGKSLEREEARAAFDIMMSGEATPSQIAGLLMALRVRGETVDELIGAVTTMRAKMLRVAAPEDALDIVGTGGDGSGTYNISTCSAFVLAGGGVPIAKHGNRAMSSKSGAGDVLAALGINLEIGPEKIAECIEKASIGFMFAPAHHAAMRFVGPSRVELGTRTIFNLLGPMSNPAGVGRQMIGVFSPKWLSAMAETLKALGSTDLWIVHGDGGLDEISISGPTNVVSLKDGAIDSFTVTPEDAGLERAPLSAIRGGDADHNAAALRAVLGGEKSAHADTVLLNAGAGFVVSRKAETLAEGVALARDSIASGNASASLEKLVEVSNTP
ncbi:MAG: anthranilate phosphoribosyltransferase [Pseudomonadota bacterium]